MKRILCVCLSVVLLLLSACGQKPEEPVASQVVPEEAQTPTETWQEHYDLGLKFLSEGNYKEAIIAFTAAITIDPKQAVVYIGRGDAFIGSGETAENLAAALADYQSAADLDGTRAEAYLGLADVYIRQGEYEKALEILKTGLDKSGNSEALAEKLAEVESGLYKDSSGKTRFKTEYDAYGAAVRYYTYVYNDAGYLTETYWYDTAWNLESYNIFELNEAGKRVVAHLYAADGSETCRWTYEYNEAGLEVRQELYYGSDLAYYWTNEYDDQGRTIQANGYYPNGSRGGYETWEYDAAGNVSRHAQYARDGRLGYYDLYQYDESGQRIRTETYDANGNLISYQE